MLDPLTGTDMQRPRLPNRKINPHNVGCDMIWHLWLDSYTIDINWLCMLHNLSCIHTVFIIIIIHTYYTVSCIVYLHLWFYLLNDDNSMMIHLHTSPYFHASLTGGAPSWDQGWLGIQTLARAVQPVSHTQLTKCSHWAEIFQTLVVRTVVFV